MGNILSQMNPVALIGVVVLLLLSVAGVLILRLIRKGRAKSAGDLVQIARERSAAAKETKAATKRAEAANAEPVASSRLSRIGAKGAEPRVETVIDWGEGPTDEAEPELPEQSSDAAELDTESFRDTPETEDAEVTAIQNDAWEPHAEALDAPADSPATAEATVTDTATIDLADPANHPVSWAGLIAIVDRLDAILAEPWSEDELRPQLVAQLAQARAAAGDDLDDNLVIRNLAQQLAATDLARTINNSAREQAAEIVAAVREFAHQGAFSADDCDAVLHTMQQVEWMALIARDNALEKRTVPLTRHDPEAPLWVAEAFAAMRDADLRSAA